VLVKSGLLLKDCYVGLLLLLLGFALRLLYVINLDISIPIRGDAIAYMQYASNLIEYGVFSRGDSLSPLPDSYWAPGFPAFLAACILLSKIFNAEFYSLVLVLQAFLGGVAVVLTYATGRLFLSKLYSVIASIFVILSPHLVSFSGYFLSETLLSVLLLAGIFFFLKCVLYCQGSLLPILSGFFFGMAYLTNPVVFFVPLVLATLFLFAQTKNNKSKVFRFLVIVIFAYGAIVSAWAIRNYVNVPAGQGSDAGRAFENLIIGSHQNYHDIWRNNPRDPDNPADKDIALYKTNQAAFFPVLAERAAKKPFDYLNWYFIGKPMELWGWNILVGQGDIYVYPVNSTLYYTSKLALISLVIMKNIHYWLLAVAIIGLFLAIKDENLERRVIVVGIYSCLMVVSVVYIVLHTDGRYSVPLRPEMYLCAAYGLQLIVAWVKKKNVGLQAQSSNNELRDK
jgi:4-amino-4-deoxy-L-arabinose transferase-like glycosyltransferase